MGQHGGLAGPFGAGRENHQEGVIVAHFTAHFPADFVPATADRPGGRGHGLLNAAGAQRGCPGPMRQQRARPRGKGLQFVLNEQQLRVRELKLRGEFLGREPPGQRDEDQPGLAQAKNTTTWSELLPVTSRSGPP